MKRLTSFLLVGMLCLSAPLVGCSEEQSQDEAALNGALDESSDHSHSYSHGSNDGAHTLGDQAGAAVEGAAVEGADASAGANDVVSAPLDAAKPQAQSSIVDNNGIVVGEAMYWQGPEGVVVEVRVAGLPEGKHGMHFHEMGTCEDTDGFHGAKGHIVHSAGKPHGYLNFNGGPHAGNLPNLIVGADGTAHVELYTSLVSVSSGSRGQGGVDVPALLDSDGSSLMIHADADDHVSQPIGNSGARIACGVVEAVAP